MFQKVPKVVVFSLHRGRRICCMFISNGLRLRVTAVGFGAHTYTECPSSNRPIYTFWFWFSFWY